MAQRNLEAIAAIGIATDESILASNAGKYF
jgi:hypothetical protein